MNPANRQHVRKALAAVSVNGVGVHGSSQVAANIADVNRGAGETGSASAEVLGSAQSLARESNQLKIEVEKFLVTVRAA